jgi:DNA repair exonuclease SbcCD nuclease subunit
MQISDFQQEHGCPVLCGGDIFDRWNAPPELINWALRWMPEIIWSIAGQHDLPLHRISDIEKSAYWTLVCAGRLEHLTEPTHLPESDWVVYPFHYGQEIQPPADFESKSLALIHKYVWIPGHTYSGASKDDQLVDFGLTRERWNGFKVAVFGDNHKGFLTSVGRTIVFNCGSLLRRKSDEKEYLPQIGLLYNNGMIEQHRLNIKQDKYLDLNTEPINKDQLDVEDFFKLLENLGATSLDFVQAVKEYLQSVKVSNEVKMVILKSLENV